ncbi:MAG: hypothetical protein ACP5GJ_03550 [Nanopusillaceae archaeon]
MSARDLIDDYKKRDGLLGLLREFRDKLINDFQNEFTRIWKEAFPSSNIEVIPLEAVGRFLGVFVSAYTRARKDRKAKLDPYLKEFTDLYNRYRNIMSNITFGQLLRLIATGERLRETINGTTYMEFLVRLHDWIDEIVFIFKMSEQNIRPYFPDIYNYYDKMVKVLVDVSTDYVGGVWEGAFEFIFGGFIHLDNFMYEVTNDLDIGTWEPFVYYIVKLIKILAIAAGYDVVFPPDFFSPEESSSGYGAAGDWEYLLRVYPKESIGTDAAKITEDTLLSMAAQVGVDVKDDVAELKKADKDLRRMVDEFPAYFYVVALTGGMYRERVVYKGYIPWDFLAYPIQEIANKLQKIKYAVRPRRRGHRSPRRPRYRYWTY